MARKKENKEVIPGEQLVPARSPSFRGWPGFIYRTEYLTGADQAIPD